MVAAILCVDHAKASIVATAATIAAYPTTQPKSIQSPRFQCALFERNKPIETCAKPIEAIYMTTVMATIATHRQIAVGQAGSPAKIMKLLTIVANVITERTPDRIANPVCTQPRTGASVPSLGDA